MSDLLSPCKHGQLPRQCPICELEAENAALRQQLAEEVEIVNSTLRANASHREEEEQLRKMNDDLRAELQSEVMRRASLEAERHQMLGELEAASHNAPWLTQAHMLCTDAGIPQGNLTNRIAILKALFEDVSLDAQRYRLLRDEYIEYKPAGYDGCKFGRHDLMWRTDERNLDAAIDQAMKEGKHG